MRYSVLFALGLGLVLSGCISSAEVAAPSKTSPPGAPPTDTAQPPTPLPPTSTLIPKTATPIPTPTPDLQVIAIITDELICTKADMPVNGQYSLTTPQNFTRGHLYHFNNQQVIISSGAPKKTIMEAYVNTTARIDGWWADFIKQNHNYSGFSVIHCSISIHQTSAGANLAVQRYNSAELLPDYGYEYMQDVQVSMGDTAVVITNNEIPGIILYEIAFSYRNYQVTITGQGKAPLDDLEYIGRRVLDRLQSAPLSPPSALTKNDSGLSKALPGETITDDALQKDILALIMLLDSAVNPGCATIKVTNTEIVEPMSDGNWAEEWTLARCGDTVRYRVTLSPNPSGGTTFTVSLLK